MELRTRLGGPPAFRLRSEARSRSDHLLPLVVGPGSVIRMHNDPKSDRLAPDTERRPRMGRCGSLQEMATTTKEDRSQDPTGGPKELSHPQQPPTIRTPAMTAGKPSVHESSKYRRIQWPRT